jgi:hypothetical protein
MGHGPARRRDWSYVQGRSCSYPLLVSVGRICGSYLFRNSGRLLG